MKLKQYSFEKFIVDCCKAREWNLRKFLKHKLLMAGFSIQEDDYRTHRANRNFNYESIHNILAIRGNPKVCLVAHTDVVRDHGNKVPSLNPILKGEGDQTIIQDENCAVQLGGDDRLGVAINTWIALNTGYDLALLFTTDEEVGNISADHVSFPELKTYKLLMQVDRGNLQRQLVTQIGYTKLCSPEVESRLLKISEKIGLPRVPVNGLMTDVLSLKSRGMCKNAINMTCGYHNNHGRNEYIVVKEAREAMKFVAETIKDYELEEAKNNCPKVIRSSPNVTPGGPTLELSTASSPLR